MFTGLVKELGKVLNITRSGDIHKLSIEAKAVSRDAKAGDSIAINGVCLTVTGKKGDTLSFDAMEETLRRTALGSLKAGALVNLEGALKAGDPVGGHFVLGHVDCVGKITDVKKSAQNVMIEVAMPEKFAGLIVEKGSIALDGISLTIGEVAPGIFKVYIIPHTMSETTLKDKKVRSDINIEFDILGKYILRQKGLDKKTITEEFLKEQGFV